MFTRLPAKLSGLHTPVCIHWASRGITQNPSLRALAILSAFLPTLDCRLWWWWWWCGASRTGRLAAGEQSDKYKARVAEDDVGTLEQRTCSGHGISS